MGKRLRKIVFSNKKWLLYVPHSDAQKETHLKLKQYCQIKVSFCLLVHICVFTYVAPVLS